jgi:long-chain acyl-CoA synthetase
MMLFARVGGKLILLPNPRDLPAVLKVLSKQTFHVFPAVSTLFNGLANHPDFGTVNWKNLRLSVGGGMAVQSAVAKLWLEKTGCAICEGYGLSETSPSASCNPVTSTAFTGTIGLPLPSTLMKCIDDAGLEVPVGQPGEIAIQGPQVMAGYWQRPDETAKVMTADGYFKTGDIGVMDERGYFRIVDRKKDMVLVSGFNVYPNEVEEVVAQLPGVLECAVVGVPDDKTGEAVKLVIVKRDAALTESQVREYCRANLTGYKQPRHIEFRTELPKTPVGKILRRELRERR